MPFDPAATFTVESEPPPEQAGFDPGKPFAVESEPALTKSAAPATRQRQPLDIGDQLRSAYDFKIDPSELLKPFPAAKAIIDAIIPDAPQTEVMRLAGVAHKPSAAERVAMKAKGALETVASPGGAVLGATGALAPEVVGPIMAATAVPQVAENVKEIARGDVAGGMAGLAINAPMLAGAAAPFALREAARVTPLTADAVKTSAESLTRVIPPERRLTGPAFRLPEEPGGPIGPEARDVVPESRQLLPPRTPMPEFTESTLEPGGPPALTLPAPGESEATAGLLPASPKATLQAGHRIELPVEPEAAARARQIWSKPIDVEAQVTGADALRSLVSLTDEAKTQGEPYRAPTVSVDLRQLEAMMQRNGVSRVESWADETIQQKLRSTSANPYFDPEFLAAAAVKAAILVKRGITGFADWSGRMKEQFGPGIEGHLPALYDQATKAYGVASAQGEKVVAAAYKNPATGQVFNTGVQHQRVEGMPPLEDQEALASFEPGFITDQGRYITRNEAAKISGEKPYGEDLNLPKEKTPTQVKATSTPSKRSDSSTTSNENAQSDLFGISQDAREQLASTGRFPYTPPGQGTTAWEEIQRGRTLIREGADPTAILTGFESTQRLSSADVAVTRAHMEQLYQEARRIEVSRGTDSPEYRAKQAEMADWWKRTKPMGTEWHKIGVGQQGLTDIDTGSLVGMEKAHFDATGERFTPEQTQVAGEHAATVNETRGQAEAAQQQVLASIERETAARAPKGAKAPPPPLTSAEARAQLGEIKGKPTPQQAQTIWQHAKRAYIEKGEANLDAIAQGTATDLGLPKRTVMEAIAGSKGARRLTDEMYIKLARARQAQMAARQWLLNEQSPGWSKWGQRLQRFLFSDKTFGHGTVGAVTHAGPLMFDPRVADIYWRDFGKQFSLAYKEGYHEAAMQDLLHRPNFVLAKRAGLQNDPFRFSDDYQSQQSQTRFGRFISAGNRGFDALKIMRQDLFDRAWSTLPSDLRTPEAASLIADRFNHATGAMTSRIPPKLGKALALAAFAPKLEGSRWAFALGDPAKAAATFAGWSKATPAARLDAIAEVKQKATMVGTYLAALAANQAYLSATGSDQEVNFTNPHRGDFLSFKGGGHEVGIVHPFTRMIGFLADLVRISAMSRGKLERLDTRRNELGERSWQYLQGKASPLAQPILDVVSQSDFQGRPMPFSSDKTPRNVRRQGEGPYTTSEYLTRTLAPIPLEEVVKEAWKSQGMEETKAEAILKALVFSTLPGATGARVKEDTRK